MSFDPRTAAADIAAALRPLGTPGRAQHEKRYMKSDLDFLGVALPDIRRVVKAAARRPGLDRDDVIAWALALWEGTIWERRIAAAELLRIRARDLTPAELPAVEGLIRAGAAWAIVDPLAAAVAGPIALGYPDAWRRIDAWAADEDFWVRRSALLSLLAGIRAGRPDRARFDRYATPMLTEKEFFIRKAIGWVLRELSKQDPGYVAGWTERHIRVMSGVTFREAVRRLPEAEAAGLIRLRAAPIS